MDSKLREELMRDEGYREEAYRDTNGFWTIGIGHLLGPGLVPRMSRATPREIDAFLEIDVADAITALRAVFGYDQMAFFTHTCLDAACEPSRVRWRALVNMAFNRGERHMRESTTITPAIKTAIVSGDWKPVADAIKASPWAAQIGARAQRLADMFEKGVA